MKRLLISLTATLFAVQAVALPFTVITDYNYAKVMAHSNAQIASWMQGLNGERKKGASLNQQLAWLAKQWQGIPYGEVGAQGEGAAAPHIQQDPIYRTDFLDCQTLVQLGTAMLASKNLAQFKKNIVKVNYGAAHVKQNPIAYYNRNNFPSADLNPVNQANGFWRDDTELGVFKKLAKTQTTLINRNRWFHFMSKPDRIKYSIRVFWPKVGKAMYKRLSNHYPKPYHSFKSKTISIDYIPKQDLSTPIVNGANIVGYHINRQLINKLPVPSVVEIVRDSSRWFFDGKNIKQVMGTGMNVSHLGFLYRKKFKRGELIYKQVFCRSDSARCKTVPVYCKNPICVRTMFLDATSAYANGQGYNGVQSLPLGRYITQKEFYRFGFMQTQSVLGIHLEKML